MKVITIGRSSKNDIVINDVKVSRIHLQLVQNDSGVCSVVDLNSVNGTFVNGQKITGEVRLQSHDVIRIGNTTLPWQQYIKPSVAVGQKPKDNVRPNPKPNRVWWYVAACVVFVLIAGGIGLYSHYNGKEQENIEIAKRNQEKIQKEQLRQEAEQKTEEAKRLQDEADELFRKALISQNGKTKALAEVKQKEATKAKKQADAAIAAQRKAESEKIAAEKEKAKVKADAKAKEITLKKDSENQIRDAKSNARKAISKANTERDYADEKARLTDSFYKRYIEMDNRSAKKVCLQLHYDIEKKMQKKSYWTDLIRPIIKVKKKLSMLLKNIKMTKQKRRISKKYNWIQQLLWSCK